MPLLIAGLAFGTGLLVLLIYTLPIFGLGVILAVTNASSRARICDEIARVDADLARLEDALSRLRAFAADPHRGGGLQRFHAHHPLYARKLPNVDDGEALSAVPLMVRCRYCHATTRADGQHCHNCGAATFA